MEVTQATATQCTDVTYLWGQILGWHAQWVLPQGHCLPAAHQSKW